MGLWTPASIATSLWLDASDPNTVLSFNPPYVGVWADAAGGIGSASQMDGSRQPELLAAQQNGLDALAFDGVDDYFDTDQLTGLAANLAGMTIFAAGADLGGGPVLVASIAGSASEARAALIHGAGYQPTASGRRLDTDTAQSVSIQSASGWGISMARFDWAGATLSVGANGAVTALAGSFQTAGSSDAAASEAVTVGGWISGATLAGQLGEIVVVPWAVNVALRQIIEGYLAHKWGVADGLPADHPYKATAPQDSASYTVAVRGTLDQQWGDALPVRGPLDQQWGIKTGAELTQLWGDAPQARGELDQAWAIMGDAVRGELAQVWGIKTAADLVQRWSDAQLIKGTLSQPWGDAGVIIGQLVQRWRDMVALRARLDQPWAIMESLLVALEQPWALTSGPIRALLNQGWHVRDIEQVAAVLHQPWAIAADGAVLRYTVDVSADGQPVRVSHVNIEADLGQDVLTAEIHPETEAEYLLCPFGASLQITVTSAAGTESFSFVVTSPRISEQHGDTRYIVEAMSPAVLLGEPYAAPVEGELSGRASVIAAALAGSIPLAWQTVDWAIPAAAWIASGETPLALLKQLAAAVGAVVQSRPDGSLVVQPAYPVSLPAWPAASPDLTLTETIDCFSTGSTPDHRPGYNRYLVSNQGSAADSLRLEESAISTTTKEVRGYQVPWDGFFDLTHTGGDWVVVEPLAIEERQETETVEFVAGAGRVRYPLYGVVAAEWQQTNLGTITTSEDGGLTSAIAGQSLLAITYTTRCRLWRVRDGQNEQLQLVAEVA